MDRNKNLSYHPVELLDVLDTIKDVMEDTLIWSPNMEKNSDFMRNNVNLTKILMSLANKNVIAKKFGKSMIMDMSVEDIMEVPTKKL